MTFQARGDEFDLPIKWNSTKGFKTLALATDKHFSHISTIFSTFYHFYLRIQTLVNVTSYLHVNITLVFLQWRAVVRTDVQFMWPERVTNETITCDNTARGQFFNRMILIFGSIFFLAITWHIYQERKTKLLPPQYLLDMLFKKLRS